MLALISYDAAVSMYKYHITGHKRDSVIIPATVAINAVLSVAAPPLLYLCSSRTFAVVGEGEGLYRYFYHGREGQIYRYFLKDSRGKSFGYSVETIDENFMITCEMASPFELLSYCATVDDLPYFMIDLMSNHRADTEDKRMELFARFVCGTTYGLMTFSDGYFCLTDHAENAMLAYEKGGSDVK